MLIAILISPHFWSYWSNHNYNATLVLDYINALKWPIITLIALGMLKPHLPVLIARMKRARGPGVDFEFAPSPGQQAISREGKEEIKEIQGDGDAPATQKTSDEDMAKLLTSPEAKLAFEQTYGVIFGTQIQVLKRLMQHIPDGLNADDFSDLLQEHQSMYASPYPTISSFMQFLLDNLLALYDLSDKRYKITNAGVYFLSYLQETNRYYIQKPY